NVEAEFGLGLACPESLGTLPRSVFESADPQHRDRFHVVFYRAVVTPYSLIRQPVGCNSSFGTHCLLAGSLAGQKKTMRTRIGHCIHHVLP
ncbi:MAG TPA: hypothetical protein VHX86_08290, partial [Tepidisphaeraceae bacterium]|nr:hypothetical protein [Tepidisphaeraceae bacterium]